MPNKLTWLCTSMPVQVRIFSLSFVGAQKLDSVTAMIRTAKG